MANEYEQYSLINKIASGGVDVGGTLLDAYRKGVGYKQEQAAAEQKSKMQDIAIQQAQANVQQTRQLNDMRAIKVDEMKKDIPYLDQHRELQMEQDANQLAIDPLQFQYNVTKVLHDTKDLATADFQSALGTADQLLTSISSSQDAYQQGLQTEVGQAILEDHPELTGDLSQDAPALDAIHKAVMAAPKYRVELEKAKIAADQRLESTRLTVEGRLRVADLKKDQHLQDQTANIMAHMKALPTPGDVRVAAYALTQEPTFDSVDPKSMPRLAQMYATMTNSYMQAAQLSQKTMTSAEAQTMTMDKFKAAMEFANPDSKTFLQDIGKLLKVNYDKVPTLTDLATTPDKTPARIKVVSPDGVAGTIPAEQLEAAKKAGYKEAK